MPTPHRFSLPCPQAVLGLLDGMAMLADVANDRVGVELEASRLPRRQRSEG